jgi:hypothetical protein
MEQHMSWIGQANSFKILKIFMQLLMFFCSLIRFGKQLRFVWCDISFEFFLYQVIYSFKL